jgi:hypothetical protein
LEVLQQTAATLGHLPVSKLGREKSFWRIIKKTRQSRMDGVVSCREKEFTINISAVLILQEFGAELGTFRHSRFSTIRKKEKEGLFF